MENGVGSVESMESKGKSMIAYRTKKQKYLENFHKFLFFICGVTSSNKVKEYLLDATNDFEELQEVLDFEIDHLLGTIILQEKEMQGAFCHAIKI